MASPLDLHLKDGIEHLTAYDRWNVLTVLILHSNVRNRCWVGMDKLAALATNGNIHKATDAKKWLLAHGAIEIVPYAERVGKEKELPPRQHVYQLTGKFDVDGRVYHYFHMNEESDLDVVDGDNINVVPIEIINGDNGSSSSLSSSVSKDTEQPSVKTKKRNIKETIPAQLMNPMKDAIAAAFGWDWQKMTGAEKGKIQRTAKELCAAGRLPTDIPIIYAYCKKKFDTFTPLALSAHATAALPKLRPVIALPSEPYTFTLDPEVNAARLRESVSQ